MLPSMAETVTLEFIGTQLARLLDYARQTDERMSRVEYDTREVKLRLTAIESQMAVIAGRLDRLEDRVARIERRAGLIEAPPG